MYLQRFFLLAFLLTTSVVFAQSNVELKKMTTSSIQPTPAPAFAPWSVNLPFVPDAAMALDGRLCLAQLTDDSVEMTSATLTAHGISSSWTSIKVPLDEFQTPPTGIFASKGHWLLTTGAAKRLLIAETDFTPMDESGARAREGSAPFSEIDDLVIEDDFIFALGIEGPEPQLAGTNLKKLDADTKWAYSLPLPDPRRRAALITTQKKLMFFGGEAVLEHATLYPQSVFLAEYDTNAAPSSYSLIRQQMLHEVGPADAAELNGIIGVLGDRPIVNDGVESTSQTLALITNHDSGGFSLWSEIPLNLPQLEDAHLVPVPQCQQFVILGGTIAATGEENLRAVSVNMPITAAFRKKYVQTAESQLFENRKPTFATLKAGLERAKSRGQYNLIFVLGSDNESDQIRNKLIPNRNFKVMTADLILSSPREEEMDWAYEILGNVSTPSIALLSPSGHIVGLHQGVPELTDMHNLLKPLWEPTNP